MTGRLDVIGLGPGDPNLITPEAQAALDQATDLLGYGPYVDRIPDRPGLTRHATDNREELARAGHALDLALAGHRVAMVSSGDPGVFAMAAAVFEACEGRDDLPEINVLPGITAMLAAAARLGAPLGHDFCAINLSDNLKPWTVIEARLRAAAGAGFAIACYNPRSKARPEGFGKSLEVLREVLPLNTIICCAKSVCTPQEQIAITSLGEIEPMTVDMHTMVIIGSSETRRVGPYVYTPRSMG